MRLLNTHTSKINNEVQLKTLVFWSCFPYLMILLYSNTPLNIKLPLMSYNHDLICKISQKMWSYLQSLN